MDEFGDSDFEFYIPGGKILFKGYERIVYGDHEPYIEFDKKSLKHTLLSKFGQRIDYNNLPEECKYYYYWLFPIGEPRIKIYLQIKPVSNLKNAPRREDGRKSNFNRVEGYADYRRGYFYVDPYDLEVKDEQDKQGK